MLQLLPTIFCFSLVLGLIFTWLTRHLALRLELVQAPSLERHVHNRPIPRIGGVAVFFAFASALFLSNFVLKKLGLHDFNIGINHGSLKAIIAGGGMVFGIGLLDDLIECRPIVKIIVEVAAATLVFLGGVQIGSFPYLGQEFGKLLSYGITVLFILFITNAFNLLDGMDGLAAGSALISTLALAATAVVNHRNPILLITTGLAGVLIAFLRYNFNPASIFLGDSGSLFIGFLLSCASISGTQKLPTLLAAAIPMLVFAVPVLDTSLSVGRRALRGKPIFAADRDHIHHRLLLQGRSHREVVMAIYGVSSLCALFMLFILYNARSTVMVLLCVSGVLVLFVARMRYPDFAEMRAGFRRLLRGPKELSRNIGLRSVLQEIEEMQDASAALKTLNRFLAPESEIEIVGLNDPRERRAARWCLDEPLLDENEVACATLIFYSNAEEFPYDIDLIRQCGAVLMRDALREKNTLEVLINSAAAS